MSRFNRTVGMLPVLLRNLADELDRNPELAERLLPSKKTVSRQKIAELPGIDPFEILRAGGEVALRERLEALDVRELKLIITRHSLDTTRSAQKWRDKQRLVSFIVDRIDARAHKGDVFMVS